MRPWLLLIFFLTACSTGLPAESQTALEEMAATFTPGGMLVRKTSFVTQTTSPVPPNVENDQATATPSAPIITPTELLAAPKPTLGSKDWQSLPVIPVISPRVIEIYQIGLEKGNNPQAFSKIGDCESTPTWFLGDFDLGTEFYNLGSYQYLEGVINNFQGSFNRTSLAARRGFKASSALTPLWADRTQCEKNEMPLACEYRVHRPVLAFIMLGTNDVYHQDSFESQMRQIIEISIEQGVIPILATKADNLEGDGSINATIAQLAWEYDIPLWNFWLAVQPLPDQGLQPDGSHLTWAQNYFNVPITLERAWPMRNLTALQVLDATWQIIKTPTTP
jgi:hypothetical protein